MKVTKILTTINKSKYGLGLGVMHSVFITDNKKVISYEAIHPFAKRKAKIYDLEKYYERVTKIISIIEITPFKISKYLKLENYMLCHEYIIYACLSEIGINPFDAMSYTDIVHNARVAVNKAIIYFIYLLTIPLLTWGISYVVYTPQSITECIQDIYPDNSIEIQYEN